MAKLEPPSPDLLCGAALFLDFDGTLVELAESPDAIRVPPRLAPLLDRLRRKLDGRLAIVSGRAIEALERHVPLSGIAFSGSHGLELQLADGTTLPLYYGLAPNEMRVPYDQLDREFTPAQVLALDQSYKDILDKYTYRNNKGNHVLCWDNARFVNHSFNSNCLTTAYDFEIAVRDIKCGEEITSDYRLFNTQEHLEMLGIAPMKSLKAANG